MNIAANFSGSLPLSFQCNQGQQSPEVRFLAKCSGFDLYFLDESMVLMPRLPVTDSELESEIPAGPGLSLKFSKANKNSSVEGLGGLPGKINYLIGNDPNQWITGVSTYAKVKYANAFPDIDMICYGGGGKLEYDFLVHPGGDPGTVSLDAEGGCEPELDENGDILLPDNIGKLTIHKPFAYQETDGVQTAVSGSFRLDGSRISFDLGGYDTSKLLIIDPILTYSTYLGGSGEDQGNGISVDSSGCAYVTGYALSTDFPVQGAYQPARAGSSDVFVTKLSTDGSTLLYSTYLGGTGNDYGQGIAVDSSGCAYVTGYSSSRNFPILGAFQAARAGSNDVFVTKLSASGSALIYSTYLGGTSDDYGRGIAIDSSGCAYVVGDTYSSSFPLKEAYQSTRTAGSNVFVTKFSALGNTLVYSTYLGGSSDDYGNGIAVDSGGCAYVTGYTYSTNFPTLGALQSTNAGMFNAFITKFNANGKTLAYSTYLGGTVFDCSYGIAVDSFGCVYVTGYSYSPNFPLKGAFQTVNAGNSDAFVSKLNAAGNALVYSTFLGGSGEDAGYGIAVDSSGSAYVTGYTNSANFPVMDSWQPANAGGYDVFITRLNASGSALIYSTYLGGAGDDEGHGIAVDSKGCAYVTGYSSSSNFPVMNAFHKNNAGNSDAVIFKLTNKATRGLELSVLMNSLSHEA